MNKTACTKIIRKIVWPVLLLPVFIGPACVSVTDTHQSGSPQPLTLQKYKKIVREGRAAYTLSEAQAALMEMSPWVEQVTGKKFLKLPPLKLVNRDQLADVVLPEVEAEYAKEFPNYTGEKIRKLSLNHAKNEVVSILGKYDEKNGTLYLVATNFDPMRQLIGIDKKHTPSLLRLVVAHELTHALQDQETGLKRLDQVDKLDEKLAFNATIEGHAVLVQNQIAERLGLQEPQAELLRFLSSESVVFREPLLEMAENMSSKQDEQTYLGGKKFIEYHYEQGGNDRVWDILAHPPFKTAMIFHPETYGRDRTEEVEYAPLFEDFQKAFSGGDWVSKNSEIGEMTLHAFLSDLDSNDRDEMVAHISRAQYLIAENSKERKKFSALALIFKEALFLNKGVDLLGQRIQRRIEALKTSDFVKVQDFSIGDLSGFPADKAIKISYSYSITFSIASFLQFTTPKENEVILYVGKGNLIIGLYPSGLDMTDEGMLNAVKIMFDQYELIQAAKP